MTLTNRFSILLLATLGLTLTGFSAALFGLSRLYLNRQVDDRLAAILVLLSTSADPKPDCVRWEPKRRLLPPNRWHERHATIWSVYNGEGRLLTLPRNVSEAELSAAFGVRLGATPLPERINDRKRRVWHVAQRRILPDARAKPVTEPKVDHDGKTYQSELLLTAVGSMEETEATLTALASFLGGVSLSIWVLAALCARWLSRKTLVPLIKLVESAKTLDATNPGWSLAEVGTHDEVDELRGAFNDLLARLHDAYNRQRHFSSQASHQLRTPIAVIGGHLEVALRYERSPEEYRRVIDLAHRRTLELGRIIEALLFLSRADSVTLTQFEPLNLGSWLQQHVESRAESLRSSDITASSPAEPIWVKAQPQLLGQLVENLLDNACKYSPAGTAIAVAAARDREWALLSVEDAGSGISAEDLPRIFDPFFRSSTLVRGRVAGVGLGLSVVQRIALAFGGSITVKSAPEGGSRFELRLPLATGSEFGEAPLEQSDLTEAQRPS